MQEAESDHAVEPSLLPPAQGKLTKLLKLNFAHTRCGLGTIQSSWFHPRPKQPLSHGLKGTPC